MRKRRRGCAQGSAAEQEVSEGTSGSDTQWSYGSLMLPESQRCLLCDCPGRQAVRINHLLSGGHSAVILGPELSPCADQTKQDCSGFWAGLSSSAYPHFHTTPSPGPGNLPSSRLEEALKSTLSILPPRPPFPPWALQLPLMLLHKDRKFIASQAALPALLRGATRSLYLPWIWSLLCP